MALTPNQWAKVEETFHRALDQPPDARESWLDSACAGDAELRAEVESLLLSDGAACRGSLQNELQQAVLDLATEAHATPNMEGRRIGPWLLIREIGRGGMGTVYLAGRDDQQYESKVAIKLVRPGLDADAIVRRFRRERQILARLEHPNISRMFDGGSTEEGIPYLVMEYIEGLWITRYAEEKHLSVDDRIQLLLPVCSAVGYAHRNFIVHRDLKPANILIDREGVPKLLDFGISKLLHSTAMDATHTQGSGLMTPDYASPEQITGEPVTLASDIYSLGAVIYELLTGTRPRSTGQSTPSTFNRTILLEPLAPPSSVVKDRNLARRLKGDLDTIVLCAMQAEPSRRYSSAENLAADLRRHLEHRPVVARPDSLVYRMGKFVRRNRVGVALAGVAIAAVLAGTITTIQEARIAGERFQDVRKLATTFVFDVEEAARDLPGSTRVRQLITRTGVEYLNRLSRSSAGDWALKRELAEAYIRIGKVQGGAGSPNLGDTAAALASFTSAGKLLDEVLRHSSSERQAVLDRMAAYYETAGLLRDSANYTDVLPSTHAGLRLAESLLAANPKDMDAVEYAGEFRLILARLDQMAGNLNAAQLDAEAGARLLQKLAEARPDNRDALVGYANALGESSSAQLMMGHPLEALASSRRQASALDALCARFPNDTLARHEMMLAYSHLSNMLGSPECQNAGDPLGAFRAGQKVVEAAKFLFDADPLDIRAMSDYGIALLRLGLVTPPQGPARKRTFELSESILRTAAVRNPENRAVASHKTWVESELAALCLANHDRSGAVHYYQMAIATAEKSLGPTPADSNTLKGLVIAVRGLAEEQARSGAREAALATLDHALRTGKTVDASALPSAILLRANVARCWQTAGSVYTILGGQHGEHAAQDLRDARIWYQQALDQWRKLEPQKGFVAPFRREMEAAVQALAPR